jgi:hypothetical protein
MARDRAKSHKAHGFTMQAMQWTADGDMPLAPPDSCVINGKSAADHEQQGKYVLGNFVHAGVKDVGDEDAPSRRRLDGDIVDPLAMMRDDLAAFETLDDLGGKEAMLMEQSIGADGFRHEARFAVVIWADEISGYTGKLILVTAKIVESVIGNDDLGSPRHCLDPSYWRIRMGLLRLSAHGRDLKGTRKRAIRRRPRDSRQ